MSERGKIADQYQAAAEKQYKDKPVIWTFKYRGGDVQVRAKVVDVNAGKFGRVDMQIETEFGSVVSVSERSVQVLPGTV